MAQYVFAPAGLEKRRNSLFRVAVEYIGSKQKGPGSDFSKGKRFIKSALNCSGRSISLACSIKDKYFNHEYKQYGTEVYYYHKEWCHQIVNFVISYLIENKNDPKLPQAFAQRDFKTVFDDTYSSRYSQLRWVKTNNYRNQQDDAGNILYKLDDVLKRHR